MPELALYDMEGKKLDQVALDDALFGVAPNLALIHQAVVAEESHLLGRSGKTRTRSEIRGSGAKIWRQKGTGRARHGDRQAPIFVGGSKAHGPRPRKAGKRLPSRMRRAAMLSALSAKVADGQVTVVDKLEVDGYSTKAVVELLGSLEAEGRVLLVIGQADEKLLASARNVVDLDTRVAPHFSVRDVVDCDRLILTQDAIAKLEQEWLS
ncbi:MAG: 50S ribosomal protein L4 [Armatimonadota bacterium]